MAISATNTFAEGLNKLNRLVADLKMLEDVDETGMAGLIDLENKILEIGKAPARNAAMQAAPPGMGGPPGMDLGMPPGMPPGMMGGGMPPVPPGPPPGSAGYGGLRGGPPPIPGDQLQQLIAQLPPQGPPQGGQ